ncbi:MAG: hypothetical protein HZB39_09580 [Planctomycetes bacterium]|nr:hypothetical protein [Planctomycetota bacterium]
MSRVAAGGLLCAIVLPLGACATGFDRHAITVAWIPALSAEADIDEFELNGGIEFDADLDAGDGIWISARLEGTEEEDEDAVLYAVEPFYATTSHTDAFTGAGVDTHLLGGMASIGVRIGGDAFALTPRFGAGVGAAIFDFDSAVRDTGGALAIGRAVLGIEVAKHAIGEIAIGAYLWGWPTETVGTGGFLTLGGGVQF